MVLQAECIFPFYQRVPAWRSLERLGHMIDQFSAHFFTSFCTLPSPFPLLTQCDRCLEDCVYTHGWVVGIASHGSVVLSRGWLVNRGGPWRSQAPIFHTAHAVNNYFFLSSLLNFRISIMQFFNYVMRKGKIGLY